MVLTQDMALLKEVKESQKKTAPVDANADHEKAAALAEVGKKVRHAKEVCSGQMSMMDKIIAMKKLIHE